MNCPNCKTEMRVIDTRKFDTCVIRVRRCLTCGSACKTVEESIEIHYTFTYPHQTTQHPR